MLSATTTASTAAAATDIAAGAATLAHLTGPPAGVGALESVGLLRPGAID